MIESINHIGVSFVTKTIDGNTIKVTIEPSFESIHGNQKEKRIAINKGLYIKLNSRLKCVSLNNLAFYPCKICGYSEGTTHVHHIDLNRSNNSVSNLIRLCPNCHFKIHHDNRDLKELALEEVEKNVLKLGVTPNELFGETNG